VGRTGWIFAALGGFAAYFVVSWIAALRRNGWERPSAAHLATGFVTNFFDTLGIGSFAPTTAIFKLGRLAPDETIPGTLNVGHTLPVIVQAFIYIGVIQVEVPTMAAMIGAAALGAWLGAGVVASLPRRAVQIGIALALLASVVLMGMGQLRLFPVGGARLGLEGGAFAAAVAGNFAIGAISTLGIGFYAPCMILVSLLGMNSLAAYPIMMGSSAFLMPVASVRFIRAKAYSVRAALGLALGGLPAVPPAAFLVKSLPLESVRWLVMAVVLYTAVMLLRASYSQRSAETGSTLSARRAGM
jgi:uncharacterized membrane protein YfcA